MKVTIDNKAKTITLDEDVNVQELYQFLEEYIKDWPEYRITACPVNYTVTFPERPVDTWHYDTGPSDPIKNPYTVTC